MDLQAQLALKGIKIQSFTPHPANKYIVIVTYSYKWITATGEVRWDYGFVYVTWPGPNCGDTQESYICQRILAQVMRTRESLKGKNPEVL